MNFKRYIETSTTAYEISNSGVVKSINLASGKASILKGGKDSAGRKVIKYRDDSRSDRTIFVHRAVAELYIRNPQNKEFVLFRDNNKNNITARNLYWADQDDINKQAIKLGSNRNKVAKLTESNIKLIRREAKRLGNRFNPSSLAKKFKVHPYTIERAAFPEKFGENNSHFSYVNDNNE